MLSVAPEGGTIANGGETVTVSGPDDPVMMIMAIPDFDGSARLAAASVTGFVAGGEPGAKKSIAAGLAPAGAAQGFEPVTHTWPTIVLPLGAPFTSQVTAKSGVFITFGVNVLR